MIENFDIEDPEQLLEVFDDNYWDNKNDIIRDISNKLQEFGYSTINLTKDSDDSEYYIEFSCKHGIICGCVWISKCDNDDGYVFDISEYDCNNKRNKCLICKKVNTIKVENKDVDFK